MATKTQVINVSIAFVAGGISGFAWLSSALFTEPVWSRRLNILAAFFSIIAVSFGAVASLL